MSIRNLVLVGLVLGLFLAAPASGQKAMDPDVAAGWAAFNHQEYAKARAAWEKAAKRGVGEAYDGLGQMFLEGAGVEANAEEARRLYELGATKKDPRSIIQLARMLGRGHGGPEDMERARELLNGVIVAHRDQDAETAGEAEMTLMALEQERMAEAGGNDAQDAIEEELRWKEGLASDPRPGAAEYREGDRANDDAAPEKAFAAWKRSAELGYAPAFARLGLLYSSGWGVAKDQAEGRRLFALGAGKGDAPAMLHLGNDLAEGGGGPVDHAQAKYWYEKVISHPEPPPGFRDWASDALARLPEDVVPAKAPAAFAPPQLFAAKVPTAPSAPNPAARPGQAEFDQARAKVDAKDLPGAIALLEQAANKGHAQAALDLAGLYSLGVGVTKDVGKAIAIVEKAAATGDPEAVKYLAQIKADNKAGALDYEKGYAAYEQKKVKEAVAFWETAAAQGYVPAMVELGLTLENGEGDAEANPKASLSWFERAAEKNDIEGLLGVGRAYLNGRVVPADLARAKESFEKARALGAGNPKAVAAADAELAVLKGDTPEDALRVGFAHYQGRKYDEAVKWFRKASDGGNFGGSFNLGLIHERGEGVPADPAQALAWFEKAKAQGHTNPEAAIARVKARLAGFDEFKKAEAAHQAKKYAEARGWYEKAADAGNIAAMRQLALIYATGIAVVKDRRTAATWYDRAAAKGDEFAAGEASSLRSEIAMWESNIAMQAAMQRIDGTAGPAPAPAKKGPPVPFDALIKHTPWTPQEIMAAIKGDADPEALAVALRTDKTKDFHDGDYQRILAFGQGTPIEEWGNLNTALLEQKIPGAGKWAKDLADAAIAARRAQLKLPPPVVDTAELRARAVAGDVEALQALRTMPEADRKLGELPKEARISQAEFIEKVRAANYRPLFWMLGEALEYNAEATKKDLHAANEYYRQAAEAGSARGAEKLASDYNEAGDGVVAPNFLELEAWLIEAAARAQPGEFTVMPPEHKLYLLYGGTNPIAYGMEMRAEPEQLRWLREMIRRGGPMAEQAKITLAAIRRGDKRDIEAMLAAIPPEVPPLAAAEVTRLETAARDGDAAAMLKLADALATGRGLRQHDRRAVEYYKQAAAKGSLPAMKQLAHHYQKGFGVKLDPAQRLAWLEKAAAAGGPEEAFKLAQQMNPQDSEGRARLVTLLEKAIAGGVNGAASLLAAKYQYGFDGFERNLDKALAVLLREAEKGNLKPAASIAALYKDKKDYTNAVLWFRKAKDAGDKTVTLELARTLGLAERHEEANAMYKESAEAGVAEGQYMYASSLEQTNPAEAYAWHKKLVSNPGASGLKTYGERFIREYEEDLNAAPGSDFAIRKQAKTGDTAAMIEYARRVAPKDRDDALSWLRWAVNKGDTTAMLMLANELFATQKDEALKLVRAAADKGSTQAMVMLANQLAATDMKAGMEWLEKAEQLGNADAKFQLGGLYFQGRGVTQDQAKGVAMMAAAADAGSLAAQFEMGRAFMQGMPGLAADQAKGLALLKKASDANAPQAAAVLGEIYERGVGTPQNLEEAHKYYRKAVSLGLTQLKAKADQLEAMLMKGMRTKK